MEFSTLPNLVPLEYTFRPEKFRFGVEEFYGWSMCNIINHFVQIAEKGDITSYDLTRFRRAVLVSDEVQRIARKERISV